MSSSRGRVVAFDATPLESPRQSGVGRYAAQLLAALLAQPDAPAVALMAGRPLPPSVVAGTLGQWRPQFPNRTIWMQVLLPAALGRLRPRVCHFTNSIAPLALRRPYVLSLHDMTVFLHPGTQTTRNLLAARGIVPGAARRAAVVVTLSESARRDIIDVLGLPSSKVRVVYPAAAPQFRPIDDEGERTRVREKYGLTAPFVLHVGTIEPRKNLPRLVEAFGRLRDEGRPEQIVLAGQLGWHYDGLLQQIARAGLSASIRILDYVEAGELPVLYNLARVVTLPSLYEGFGLPILEAMASGVPVLTSNRSAMVEIAGGAAQLIDPESIDSLTDGLRRILDDDRLRAQLKADGLQRAAGFSWNRTAAQMIQIYDEVGA